VKKKEWLKTEIDEPIDLYHNKPVLSDVEDKVYRDRIKKRDALVEMAEIFATSTEEQPIQCENHLWNKFSNFKTNDICQKR
jgi:hypothetical protein